MTHPVWMKLLILRILFAYCKILRTVLFHKKMFWYYEIISCSLKQHLQISRIVSMTSLLGHSVAQPTEYRFFFYENSMQSLTLNQSLVIFDPSHSSYQKLFCGLNSLGKNLYLVGCATVCVLQKWGHANSCVWSSWNYHKCYHSIYSIWKAI